MTKTIDIRKPAASITGLSTIRRAGKSPSEEPAVEKKPLTEKKAQKKSFVTRFIELAIFDVKRKLGLVKAPAGEFQQRISDFEKFEEFCKLARGVR